MWPSDDSLLIDSFLNFFVVEEQMVQKLPRRSETEKWVPKWSMKIIVPADERYKPKEDKFFLMIASPISDTRPFIQGLKVLSMIMLFVFADQILSDFVS